jgi:hypothetical protein
MVLLAVLVLGNHGINVIGRLFHVLLLQILGLAFDKQFQITIDQYGKSIVALPWNIYCLYLASKGGRTYFTLP